MINFHSLEASQAKPYDTVEQNVTSRSMYLKMCLGIYFLSACSRALARTIGFVIRDTQMQTALHTAQRATELAWQLRSNRASDWPPIVSDDRDYSSALNQPRR